MDAPRTTSGAPRPNINAVKSVFLPIADSLRPIANDMLAPARRSNNRFMFGASLAMLLGIGTYYYYVKPEKQAAYKRFTLVTPTTSHGPEPVNSSGYIRRWNEHPNASRSNNKSLNQTQEVHGVVVERSGGGL
ncbi:uncharacterized protein V2V93DRAFT_381127 [Kockiozyma suomiensis]|uniref:uncharacterized protein n=1 Tax=Kockiozyma suomiensis TaxID=1337062 RepID=UPI003343A33F